MVEARGEILDFMLANLNLDKDIEVSSDLFIDKENHELVLMFCLDQVNERVKEIPAVLFIDEDNIQRVNEETQVSIFNRLGTEGSCSTAPDKIFVQSAKKCINDKRISRNTELDVRKRRGE